MRRETSIENWVFIVEYDGRQLRECLKRDKEQAEIMFIHEDFEPLEWYADNESACFRTLYDKQEQIIIFENREIILGYDKELMGGFYLSIQTSKEFVETVEGEEAPVYNCDMIPLTRKQVAQLGDFFKDVKFLPTEFSIKNNIGGNEQ